MTPKFHFRKICKIKQQKTTKMCDKKQNSILTGIFFLEGINFFPNIFQTRTKNNNNGCFCRMMICHCR